MKLAEREPPDAFARELLKRYSYPVDSELFDWQGNYLDHYPAANMLQSSNPDRDYLTFLRRALTAEKASLPADK